MYVCMYVCALYCTSRYILVHQEAKGIVQCRMSQRVYNIIIIFHYQTGRVVTRYMYLL